MLAIEVRETGDLTGVSKYFYDLDETLNTKSTNPPLEIISKLATELKTEYIINKIQV
jgi:hypothetical protein